MSPRELALHLLKQRFGAPRSPTALPDLAAFQQEAHARLLVAIERYGGALLADSVGLGKTFVAAAVARSLSERGQPLVVVPTALLRTWRRALHGIDRVRLLTHATLSRSGGQHTEGTGLVVVDEAHAFRNPRTRRYAALANLVRGRPLLLLTATPVNNSVWDLYWLLRLFAPDDAFAELGVPDLGACCEYAQRTGRSGRVPAVLGAVAVRRSRAVLAELGDDIRVRGLTLSFPRREPPRAVTYDLPAALRLVVDSTIEALELRPWQDFGPAVGVCLLRLTLLKRLESSAFALRASLLRLHATLQAFADALGRGLLLAPADRRAWGAGDPAQLALDALVLRPLPSGCDREALRASAAGDLDRLQAAIQLLAPAGREDAKFAALRRLLRDEIGERPVLLFTEFRDTAEYLWRALRDELPCALIHGSAAWLGRTPATRRLVVERFAPIANGVPPPATRERVRLLIATDVLAEGLNLQDAADVVSYDLPWNPVRLVQRLGRVDRLGSPHTAVRSWYFAPGRELDALLGLLRRIRIKLRAIRATVGAEAPVLAPTAPPQVLRALAAGDATPLAAAERRGAGGLEIEERLRAAWLRAVRTAPDPLAGLPLAAGMVVAPPAGQPATPARQRGQVAQLNLSSEMLPHSCRGGRPTALVFLSRGNAHRAVFVSSGRCFEDDVAAGETILHALRQTQGTEPTSLEAAEHAARTARRWVARTSPLPVRRSPGADFTVRLLRLLHEQPGGPSAQECRRVERLIRILQAPLAAADEVALRALRREPEAQSLAALLERLESQIGSSDQPAAPARRTPAVNGYSLAGVFLLDSHFEGVSAPTPTDMNQPIRRTPRSGPPRGFGRRGTK